GFATPTPCLPAVIRTRRRTRSDAVHADAASERVSVDGGAMQSVRGEPRLGALWVLVRQLSAGVGGRSSACAREGWHRPREQPAACPRLVQSVAAGPKGF